MSNPIHGVAIPPEHGAPERSHNEPRPTEQAARQFEGLLIRQLLSVMRKTVPEGGLFQNGTGSTGEMYLQMMDDALAEKMTEGGGLGLAAILERSMGGDPDAETGNSRATLQTVHRSHILPLGPTFSGPTLPGGSSLSGATGALQAAATNMVGPEAASRWSRNGTLGPADLASTVETQAPGGVARFNVRDALGYQGYYKCNLFAFELARRAGFQVPVVGRERGWGFPGADTVARDAATDDQVRGNWARVATGAAAEDLDRAIVRGERAFMLTASAPGERPGHMAVVERVHSVDYDESGAIARIVFDGWEAKPSGARHLTQRTWNRIGNDGGTNPHGGFDGIEILELRRAPVGTRPEVTLSSQAGPSLHDVSPSRSTQVRPMTGSEEDL